MAGSTEHEQFHDAPPIRIVCRAHDDHDEGLVHNHEWAAAK
jgi:hypothetical protein